MNRPVTLLATMILGLMIPGCAFVDSSFEARIGTVNNGYGGASNTEVLTNIVRASHFEPLRFYQHTKIAPSQTSDLKVGLPTVTLGPGQTAEQKEFAFASNGADNSASLSLEVDPLETRDFHHSLISPIPIGTMGLLLQNFPRELVFLTLLESVRFQERGEVAIEYRNIPLTPTADCPEYHYDGTHGDADYDPTYPVETTSPVFAGVPRDPRRSDRYRPPGTGAYTNLRNCPYQRFRFWVANMLAYGLSIDFQTEPNPDHNVHDSKDTQPSTIVVGHVCFDPALAQRSLASIVATFRSLCGKATPTPGRGEASKEAEFPFFFESADGRRITVDVRIRLRSLFGVYSYLGQVLVAATQRLEFVPIYSLDSRANGDSTLLSVERDGRTTDCFATASIRGRRYCVPGQGSDNTHQLFAMLSELASLIQSASDVPNSLTVRLTP